MGRAAGLAQCEMVLEILRKEEFLKTVRKTKVELMSWDEEIY